MFAIIRGELTFRIFEMFRSWRLHERMPSCVSKDGSLDEVKQKELLKGFEAELFSMGHGSQLLFTNHAEFGCVPGAYHMQVEDEIWNFRGEVAPFVLRGTERVTGC